VSTNAPNMADDEVLSSSDSTEPTGAAMWSPRGPAGSGRTVTLKLDAEGNLAPLSERMQQRLQEMAARGDWTGATGLPAPSKGSTAAQPAGPSIKPTPADLLFAEGVMAALSHLKQAMWAIAGLSKEKREELLAYTKPQVENVKEPLAVVINKHSNDWFRKYREEMQVLMVLGVIELSQVQMCTMALVKERKERMVLMGRERDAGVTQMPSREPRTEPRQPTKTSADESVKTGNECLAPGCMEQSVPGVGYCRIHRAMSGAKE
jgi:hypothetical protein